MVANKWNIPKHELETIERCFLPNIPAFFESEEGRKEYGSGRRNKPKQRHKEPINRMKMQTKQGVKSLPCCA